MGKFLKKAGGVVPVGILGLIWTILVLVFADFEKAGFMFWGGFVFGFIAFAGSTCCMYFTANKTAHFMSTIFLFTEQQLHILLYRLFLIRYLSVSLQATIKY